jgi:hypothetical protein
VRARRAVPPPIPGRRAATRSSCNEPRRILPYPEGVDGRNRYDFAIDPRYVRLLRLFGVRPGRAWVALDRRALTVRFGFWRFSTELSNIDCVRITGPYSAIRAIGPRISLADLGISFCTNVELGVCALFRSPVPGPETLGVVKHPGLTVTPEDPRGFVEALTAARDEARR